MKLSLRIALFTAVLTAFGTPIRAAAPIVEPRYLNSFYAVASDGGLIELERISVTFHSKVHAFIGYASVKMSAEFKPGQSLMRLPANVQFVVRGRSELDPASRFELRKLKASKSHREIVMVRSSAGVFNGDSTSDMHEGSIPLQFEEYGTNSYRITVAGPLEPGEYALALRGMVTELYCFGVD